MSTMLTKYKNTKGSRMAALLSIYNSLDVLLRYIFSTWADNFSLSTTDK
jgi:hypothetical protein